MGTTSVLPKNPQGKMWNYSFKSADAEGSISVGFKNLQKDIAVMFIPPDTGVNKFPKALPIVGIQIFDTSGSKNPFSKNAVEMTTFGNASDPKNAGILILTIIYSRLNATKIRKLYMSSLDSNGKTSSTTIDLASPQGSSKKPFIYTAKKANTKTYKLILEISEWPAGDPLISHG